ncbi:hypothetical protein FVEG_13751 [Fusarium verticillioides 7600]|uniref:Uncharacterized protein n=1 Tax=Gibberella moniliformis (strain M3125 / FGSC 7600) TaxID=334819 RepID=W7MWY3_GIBM7|nr:hypothetical protein FVEG_13751 [Fusarium verticillioides 7600]EWG55803.1 hypothetical protein FVEG_13751 [Fusarium verticillioides 7600]
MNDQSCRNESQVVSKYLREDERGDDMGVDREPNQWTFVRVNQLWIWNISADGSPDILVEEILNSLSKQEEYGGSGVQPVSAAELVPTIIDLCISSYERRPNDGERLSIGQTFSHYINRIAHSHGHDISAAIKKAKDLYCDIKDVRDELNILKTVAQYQQIVRRGLASKEINTTLSLQQSEVANRQATEATRQGKTVMTFTFANVLFLPLSFLSYLFALDVASFQEAPAWAFYIIFLVSIGISTILGLSVFY